MILRTEESQLRSAQQSLLKTFEGQVPRARIIAELEATRETFRDARIRTYVPILIQRQVANRLRELPHAVAS